MTSPETSASAERVRQIVRAFEDGYSPASLYDAMDKVAIADESTVLALLDGLQAEEWRAVLACTGALGRSQHRLDLVLPALLDQLQHPENLIQEVAVQALGLLGGKAESAVAAILELLHQKEAIQYTEYAQFLCIEALGKIAAHPALVVPALLKQFPRILQGTDFRLFQTICATLSLYPDHEEEIVPVLWDALSPKSDYFGYAQPLTLANALLSFPAKLAESMPRLLIELQQLAQQHDSYAVQNFLTLFYERLLPSHGNQFCAAIAFSVLAIPPSDYAQVDSLGEDLKPFITSPYFSPADLEQLASYLDHAEPKIRLRAAHLLACKGKEAGFLLPRMLPHLEDPDAEVCRALLNMIGQIATPTDALLQTLQALHSRENLDARVQGAVRYSLIQLGQKPPVPVGGIDAAANLQAFHAIAHHYLVGTALVGQQFFLAYHNILQRMPETEWATDADEFGLVTLAGDDPTRLQTWTLPVTFPVQATGGFGAKRRFRFAIQIGADLLFSLYAPFSDQRGWGNDNYLYSFSTTQQTWSRLRLEKEPGQLIWETLDPAAPLPEHPNHSFGYGDELELQPGTGSFLEIGFDYTPYHLDDWEDVIKETVTIPVSDPLVTAANSVEWLQVSQVSDSLWLCDSESFTQAPSAAEPQPHYCLYDVLPMLLQHHPQLAADQIAQIRVKATEIPCNGETKLLLLIENPVYAVMLLSTEVVGTPGNSHPTAPD